MSNTNLSNSKIAKNDEFYTSYNDIESELQHYPGAFQGKTIYCNCDNPEWSNFWRYFHLNFEHLGLKKLIATHYDKEKPTYKMEYTGGDDNNIETGVKTPLEGNGDFRNQECIDLLEEADIVVTNPPFSLFREYVSVLEKHNKKFLIIGNPNAVTYKEFFPLLKENKVRIGAKPWSSEMYFGVPEEQADYLVKNKKEGSAYVIRNGQILGRAATLWFTNLDIKKRHEKLILWKNYTPAEFPQYDNYDAINVDKVSNIPCDYCESWEVTEDEFKNFSADEWEVTRTGERDGEKSFFIIPAKGTPLRKRLSEHRLGYKEEIEGKLLKYIKKKIPSAWQPETLKDLPALTQQQEKMARILEESLNTEEFSSERYCNGIAGVPITFLDKYNPEQFEIVNANDYRKAENVPIKSHGLIKDKEGAVKKNCVCQNLHQEETLNCSHLEAADGISPENGNMQGFLSDRYCNGIIGVPVTFLDKMNPNQFKIIGRADGNIKYDTPECYIPGFADKGGTPMINTKFLYKRILIQKKL